MWAIELVGRAGEKVTVEIFDIDQSMRRKLDGVDVNDDTGLMRHLGQGFNVVHATGQIARIVQCHEPGAVTQQRLQQLWLDAPGVAIKFEPLHYQVIILGHLQPGRDITFVLHARDDDFVTRRKLVPETT